MDGGGKREGGSPKFADNYSSTKLQTRRGGQISPKCADVICENPLDCNSEVQLTSQ